VGETGQILWMVRHPGAHTFKLFPHYPLCSLYRYLADSTTVGPPFMKFFSSEQVASFCNCAILLHRGSAVREPKMDKQPVQLLSPSQVMQLTELAERARLGLSRFSGAPVEYNVNGLQLLDEWIDRHLRQFPQPSPQITTVWGAFLGAVFCKRFQGEWGIETAQRKPKLGIRCPKEDDGFVFVDVMEQIERRIKGGMEESLAYYYTVKGVEIREESF